MKKNDYFIDVSSYQSADLTAICAAAGTKNTIIKVSESTTYLNPSRGTQAVTSTPVGYYHFARFGGNVAQAQAEANFFIANLPNPKPRYLVCDYEDNASGDKQANTNAVLAFMDKCKSAGFDPIYYSYKPYTLSNIDYHQILAKYPNSLWIAAYPNYNVTPTPVWSVFPSMDGIRWWQFTSTAIAGGLDKNVVLLDDEQKTVKKSAKPTAKLKVETVNYKDKAFAVRLYDVKSPDGISKVQFPIWTDKGGQDDLKWQDAVKQADGTWLFVDNAKNHKGELGKYNVHAYITTPDGVNHGVATTTTNLTPSVTGKLSIKDIDAAAGTFVAELSEIKSPVEVKGIKFPVWTEDKGQDDLKWYNANKNIDGSYSVIVPIKNHGNKFGTYNVHCYADIDGATVGVAGTKAEFKEQPKTDNSTTEQPEIIVVTKGDATVKTVVLSQEEFDKIKK